MVVPDGMINLYYKAYSCNPGVVRSEVAKFAKFAKSAERWSRSSVKEQAKDLRFSVLDRGPWEDCAAVING